MNLLNELRQNLMEGKFARVEELTRAALREGVGVREILNEGLISGMNVVGEKFKENEIFVPEVLMAAKAMRAGMTVLEPLLASGGIKALGTVILGTVEGDVHDLGKNLVGVMLKGAGFEVIDLGIDVSPQKFVDAGREKGAQLIGMSGLLSTSMPIMKVTIDALATAGMKDKVKTIIGGAPVTQRYADSIGADAYAKDAGSAVYKAKELLGLA